MKNFKNFKKIFLFLFLFLTFSLSCDGNKKPYYATVHYLEAKSGASKTTDVTSRSKTYAFATLSADGTGGYLATNALAEFNKTPLSGVTIGSTTYGTCGVGRVKSTSVEYNDIAKAVEGETFSKTDIDNISSHLLKFGEDLYILYAPPTTAGVQ